MGVLGFLIKLWFILGHFFQKLGIILFCFLVTLTSTEVKDIGKDISIQHCGINYDRKNSYYTDSGSVIKLTSSTVDY